MPYTNGVFTRVRSWVADKAAGLSIEPDLMDADADDMALGLSTAMLRDGTSVATADLPMGGHKLINLGAPVNPGDAIGLGALPASEIKRSLNFLPALPLTGSASTSSIGGLGVGSGALTNCAGLTFAAQASSLVVLGSADWIAMTPGGGEVISQYINIVDLSTGGRIAVSTTSVVSVFYGNGYKQLCSFCTVTGLIVSHSYQILLYAYQNDAACAVNGAAVTLNYLNV